MNGGGNVRIFVNLPNADNRSSSDLPNYVGYFAQVPSSLGGHSHRPLNISIDVTDKLPALQRAGAALTVTLVPLNRPSGPPRLGSARIVVE